MRAMERELQWPAEPSHPGLRGALIREHGWRSYLKEPAGQRTTSKAREEWCCGLQDQLHLCVSHTFVAVQSISRVWLFSTPWTPAHQALLSSTVSWNLLKLMSIESMMPSKVWIYHLAISFLFVHLFFFLIFYLALDELNIFINSSINIFVTLEAY